ncbi:hypothetical protein RRG08_054441 [Elysia crispata]|uniref:Uncharacterized protein n=1 Tax=Elysia crispata TaxID=231223 RepID=A0AAE1AXR3_9GAST|nr:hypothetical protein RRG08_054441 [Elysia crispata]
MRKGETTVTSPLVLDNHDCLSSSERGSVASDSRRIKLVFKTTEPFRLPHLVFRQADPIRLKLPFNASQSFNILFSSLTQRVGNYLPLMTTPAPPNATPPTPSDARLLRGAIRHIPSRDVTCTKGGYQCCISGSTSVPRGQLPYPGVDLSYLD